MIFILLMIMPLSCSPQDSLPTRTKIIPTIISSKVLAKEKFETLFKEIQSSIDKDVFPEVLLDSCLDWNNYNYCYVGSHRKLSMRNDLINNLSKDQLAKLYKMSMTVCCLDAICAEKTTLPFRNCSTKKIIEIIWDSRLREVSPEYICP
ncbi:MAG: hypothetical protein EOP48_06370 [Sphingobacteriales bacterium]|nr:MAG: hypothetical protein EOP48_06370 [Sphingobacteriales bacterium]